MAMQAIRFSDGVFIKAFLEVYDTLCGRDREAVPIEAIALSAGLDVKHFWGELMLAMREHSVNSVKAIAIDAHPEVIKKRVEYAKTPGGFRDRDALDTMLGALPSPKGPTFIGKFFATTTKEMPEDEEQAEELVDDLDYMFPDSSLIQEKITPAKQLGGK